MLFYSKSRLGPEGQSLGDSKDGSRLGFVPVRSEALFYEYTSAVLGRVSRTL
jgi:hypothetical protein